MIRTTILFAAASLVLAPIAAHAQDALVQDKGGKPGSTSTAQEVANTRALNQAQADAARAQEEANRASAQEYQARIDDFETQTAAVSGAHAAYEADLAANRQARADYDAAYARWQADVAACTAGDYARCQGGATAPK